MKLPKRKCAISQLALIPIFINFLAQFQISYSSSDRLVIFYEDFEDYNLGKFTTSSSEDWRLVLGYDTDPENQRIVDSASVSGTKSLQLQAETDTIFLSRKLEVSSKVVGYQVFVTRSARYHILTQMMFIDLISETLLSRVYFWLDEIVVYRYEDGRYWNDVLQNCKANEWYNVTVITNTNNLEFSVWINGVFKGNFQDDPDISGDIEIEYFQVRCGHASSNNIYLDDISVFQTNTAFSVEPALYSELADARAKLYESIVKQYEFDVYKSKELILEVLEKSVNAVFLAAFELYIPSYAKVYWAIGSLLSDASDLRDSLDWDYDLTSLYTLRGFDSEGEYSSPAMAVADYPDEFLEFLWNYHKPLYDLRTVYGSKELDADCVSVEMIYMSWLCLKEKKAWEEGDLACAKKVLEEEDKFLSEHLAKWVPIFNNKIQNDELPALPVSHEYKGLMNIIEDTITDDLSYVKTLADFDSLIIAADEGEIEGDGLLSWILRIPSGLEGFIVRTFWGGSDIDIWIIDPHGHRYEGIQTTPTLEEIMILDPVAGDWTLYLHGKDIPIETEAFDMDVSIVHEFSPLIILVSFFIPTTLVALFIKKCFHEGTENAPCPRPV